MHQRVEGPEARPATGTCAKRTLAGTTRVGLLLVAAVGASMLMVDLPLPIGRGDLQSPAYVPASGEWTELGASPELEMQEPAAPVAEQMQPAPVREANGPVAERSGRDRDLNRRAPQGQADATQQRPGAASELPMGS